MQRHVEEADVDVSSFARRARAGERRQHGVSETQSGHEVHDGEAETRRRSARLAGQGEIACFGLHKKVEARPICAWAGAPVGREVGADQLLVV